MPLKFSKENLTFRKSLHGVIPRQLLLGLSCKLIAVRYLFQIPLSISRNDYLLKIGIVRTHLNPVDLATRGRYPSQLLENHTQLSGPDFLYELTLPSSITPFIDSEALSEERKLYLIVVNLTKPIDDLMEKYSSLFLLSDLLVL